MKRLLLAILSGLLFSFSWPTFGFPGLLFIAFVPLLYLEHDLRTSYQRHTKLKLFLYAYLCFLIWNFATTSWLSFADLFGASFAILVNSLLMALLILIYHGVAKRASMLKSLIFFATLWISFEYLHLKWEFSWPWLNLGNAFSEYYNWVQWYQFTGVFGGTLWVIIGNILIFNLLILIKNEKVKFSFKHLLPFALLVLLPIGLSYIILISYKNEGETVHVIALQPNIDPYSVKYNTPNNEIADLLLKLANDKVDDSTDYIIAPETVFARNVRIDHINRELFKYRLDSYIEKHPRINILTGISFIEFLFDAKEVKSETNRLNDSVWYNDFNSALQLNSDPDIDIYHKSKLVVGVENFPYQDVLKPIIGDAMIDLGGTVAMKTTQNHRSVFKSSNDKFRVGPLICYESVYGEFVSEYIRNGANFLAIITNDGWWADSQGHKQHLSYARLRAIESRRYIVRSANTGISALIDDKGNIYEFLEYNKRGALSGQIKTNEQITFYVKAGDYIARISLMIMILLGLISYFRKSRANLKL